MPLTKPTPAESATTAGITTQSGQPSQLNAPSAAILARAKFDPTLRSIPPASITIIIARTTNENSPSWRVELASADCVKNSGMRLTKTAMTTTSPTIGTRLSIQRLVRISPRILVGAHLYHQTVMCSPSETSSLVVVLPALVISIPDC